MTWQRVRAEFEALVGQPAAVRQARLLALESTDRWLAGELRSLLRHDAEAPQFLERDAMAAAAPPAVAGRRLGRFELLKPLGTGGMGAVWEARQQDPERRVAVKLVARRGRSDAERWRFQHEVQVLAVLNHPAIATFYEAGHEVVDGTEVSWLAMELVEDAVDVLTWARERGLARDARLDLFLRLCDAVEYGHRRGVLHRDLKPGNVLVGVDGRLKLIDFGIARALEGGGAAAPARTLTGEIVGTVQYMAPEQLQGRADAIGTACDVWALGVLLYHLLCDRAPFDFDGVPLARIAATVLEREPLDPAAAKPDLPQDLRWILLRALEKEPARRYATVRDLADDLARFRTHEPVRARPPSFAYRTAKFARRHRVAVAIALALAVGLGVGAFGLLRGIDRARAGERAAVRGTALSREVARVTVALFDGIDDTEASRDMKVHELLDAAAVDERATAEPLVEGAIRELRGTVYDRLHRYAEARRELERARELHGQEPTGSWPPDERAYWRERGHALDARLGRVLVATGEGERGRQLVRDAVAATQEAADATRIEVLSALCRLLSMDNASAELEPRAAELGTLARRAGDVRTALNADLWFAEAVGSLGRKAEAKAAAARAWAACRGEPDVPRALACRVLSVHVTALQEAGDLDAAEALYPELIELTRAVFGPTHPNVLTTLNNHAGLLMRRGRRQEAVASLREIVRIHDERGGTVSPEHLAAINNLGMVLNSGGQFADAEPILARAAGLSPTLLAPRDPNGPMMRFNHAACLAWQKRWSEAEPILLEEYRQLEQLLPPGHAWLGSARRTIADACAVNGSAEQAANWRAK